MPADTSFWDGAPAKVTAFRRVTELPMPDGLDDPGNLDSLFGQKFDDDRLDPVIEPDVPKGAKQFGKSLWAIREPWVSADIPRRPWIARGYAMRGAVTVVSGPGSAGKSMLMVAYAACASVGSAFKNFKPAAMLRVATYNVEDDGDEQRRRFSAMFQRLGLDLTAFGDRLAILGPRNVGTLLTVGHDGRALLNTDAMDELELFVDGFRPDVLMLDPFVELHDADENDNTVIRAVMARFRILASKYAMAVIVLHHARKGAGDPGDPESLRGASSIVGAARVVLTLAVMTKDEAKAFGIGDERRRLYFRLDGAKSNYAPIEEAEWFERQEIRLDNDGGDEQGDGVAVAWPWKPPSTIGAATPEQLNRCLDTIASPGAGWLFSPRSNGKHWAGAVLIRQLGYNEKQAAALIRAWLKTGTLYIQQFEDDQRKSREGVRVDDSKRPTADMPRPAPEEDE